MSQCCRNSGCTVVRVGLRTLMPPMRYCKQPVCDDVDEWSSEKYKSGTLKRSGGETDRETVGMGWDTGHQGSWQPRGGGSTGAAGREGAAAPYAAGLGNSQAVSHDGCCARQVFAACGTARHAACYRSRQAGALAGNYCSTLGRVYSHDCLHPPSIHATGQHEQHEPHAASVL